MLPILQNNSILTMTTREIADLTDKRHDNVFNVCEKLIELGVLESRSPMIYTHPQNHQEYELYVLNKRDSLILAGRLSPEFMAKIFDRWQELENNNETFAVPKTLPEALRLAADLADQIAAQAPMVEVYKLLADRKEDVSTTIIAKELGTTAFKLNKFLRDTGAKWLNADLPKAGFESWFNVVADVRNGHEFTQCLVTPAGQIKIAKLWSEK